MRGKYRVGVCPCVDYEPGAVRQAVGIALERSGGGPSIGRNVLLKANLLAPVKPERAVTTHPEVLSALADWVREKEPDAHIEVSDSPGYLFSGQWPLFEENCGLRNLREKWNVELSPLNGKGYVEMQSSTSSTLGKLQIPVKAVEADTLINVAKCKTHVETEITACLKNTFRISRYGHAQKGAPQWLDLEALRGNPGRPSFPGARLELDRRGRRHGREWAFPWKPETAGLGDRFRKRVGRRRGCRLDHGIPRPFLDPAPFGSCPQRYRACFPDPDRPRRLDLGKLAGITFCKGYLDTQANPSHAAEGACAHSRETDSFLEFRALHVLRSLRQGMPHRRDPVDAGGNPDRSREMCPLPLLS